MDATRFSTYAKNVFSPEMTPISRCAGMSYGSNDTFGDFLAHSVQKFLRV